MIKFRYKMYAFFCSRLYVIAKSYVYRNFKNSNYFQDSRE